MFRLKSPAKTTSVTMAAAEVWVTISFSCFHWFCQQFRVHCLWQPPIIRSISGTCPHVGGTPSDWFMVQPVCLMSVLTNVSCLIFPIEMGDLCRV